jgi:hypothetical protein
MINKVKITIEAHFRDGQATRSYDFIYDESVPDRIKNLVIEEMSLAEANGHDCDC